MALSSDWGVSAPAQQAFLVGRNSARRLTTNATKRSVNTHELLELGLIRSVVPYHHESGWLRF